MNWIKENKLISIIVLAFLLRLYKLGFQSAWLDELHTLIEGNPKLSFEEMTNLLVFRGGIPHLHHLIVQFFGEQFTHGIVSARMVSVIFGTLSVYATYCLGKNLWNKNVGLASAMLIAVNVFAIEYSQEARSYAMLLCFVTASFNQLVLVIQNKKWQNAILLGLFTGLVFNVQPIGALHVASVYLILLIYFILDKENRIPFFKLGLLSVTISLLLLYPVIPFIERVSEYKSFWIAPLTFQYFVQVFEDLFGKSTVLLFIFSIAYVLMNYLLIQNIKTEKGSLLKSNYFLTFLVINIWILFKVIVMSLKSYFGISIFLHRYFIGLIPAFMITIVCCLALLKNTKIKTYIFGAIVLFMLIHLFFIRKYYTTLTKSQYNLVAQFVEQHNAEKLEVVSTWGYVMGYFFNDSNQTFTIEKNLNAFLDDIRNGQYSPNSFWYIDGNSNKFVLSDENRKFVSENYRLEDKIEKFDAWAVKFHYINNDEIHFNLRGFGNKLFDGQGQLVFATNDKITYPSFNLEKGNYTFMISLQSLPELPIDNVNAHFKLYVNGEQLADFFASEKLNSKPVTIDFSLVEDTDIVFELEYDNDVIKSKELDRNAILKDIFIKKL